MAISKKDQAELRRIVRTSFELLDAALKQRKREVKAAIRSEIEKKHKTALTEVRKELKTYVDEATKLQRQAQDAVDRAKNRGIGFSSRYTTNVIDFDNNLHHLEVQGLNDRVEEAYEQIAIEHGAASFDLKRDQLELERDLAIGAIEGEGAQEFLERIPSVDTLLPSPTAVKRLISA